ncbi:MAG: hypothetical protein ACE5D7_09190, partial [Fidelibacterota bacterium]
MIYLFFTASFGQPNSDGQLIVTSNYFTDNIRTPVINNNQLGQLFIQVDNNNGFSVGDEILIITMQDDNVDIVVNMTGKYETRIINTIKRDSLFFNRPLSQSFNTSEGEKHQVIRIPNYTSVIVENGGKITANNWDGNTGGIVFFRAKDSIHVAFGGMIDVTGKGYRGGISVNQGGYFSGYCGESIISSTQYFSNQNNIGGGGAGYGSCGEASGAGGYGSPGSLPTDFSCSGGMEKHGQPGTSYGDASLKNLFLGSGGGGGSRDDSSCEYTEGQNGGGIIFLQSPKIVIYGNVFSNGLDAIGGSDGECDDAIGGAGSGGSIFLLSHDILLFGNVLAKGGEKTYISQPDIYSGIGGDGRIRIHYTTSFTNNGIFDPTPAFTIFQSVAPTGLPYNIIIKSSHINNKLLKSGDQIAVFDDTLCVGVVTLSTVDQNQNIVAWQADISFGLAGYTSGNPITFKILSSLYGAPEIFNPDVTYIVGDGLFGYETYSVVDLEVTAYERPLLTTLQSNILFGSVPIWTTVTDTVFLVNAGERNLIINSIQTNQPVFSFIFSNPVIISPEDTFRLPISFTPNTISAFTGDLIINSNDDNHSITTITLTGLGTQSLVPEMTGYSNTMYLGEMAHG